ncbi:MAG TPA: TAXI family TRAP transporter solute-binding subunit [Candidatus Deferrimicrobium sp.]|nr:TAXI family TRAP transporter solute-binding subunit [Candidatus Deferrimicrobium sp.]
MAVARVTFAFRELICKPVIGLTVAVALAVLLAFALKVTIVGSVDTLNSGSGQPSEPHTYKLATGSEGGVYYKIGREIDSLRPPGMRFEVITTPGSFVNIALIDSGRADFAFVQSDVAYNEYKKDTTVFKIIASLYVEPIQICVRKGLHLESPKDLEGKKVSLGEKGSGTESNARQVLGAAGVALHDLHTCLNLKPDSALAALKAGEIDAAFFTAGTPHSGIGTLLDTNTNKAYLLGLDAPTIKSLKEEFPKYMTLCSVPENTYPNMKTDINTIGVTACLICSNESVRDSKDIDSLLEFLFRCPERLRAQDETLKVASIYTGVEGIDPTQMHPAAHTYFHRHNVFLYRSAFSLLNNVYPAMIVAVLVAFRFFGWRRVKQGLRKVKFLHNYLAVLFYTVMVLTVTGVTLFYLERGVNSGFSNFGESMWSIIVYSVSGFEDRAPLTTSGKAISIVGVVATTILASFLTGVIAAVQMKGSSMNADKKDILREHVIILGWSDKARKVVRELVAWGCDVEVLSEHDEDSALNGLIKSRDNIRYFKGSPRRHENLRELQVANARSVVILSSNSTIEDPDWLTAQTLMEVVEMKKSLKCPPGKPHVVVEIVKSSAKATMCHAGADEVVSSEVLGEHLLVDCAVNPGVSLFFEDLLSLDDNSNQVYYADVPGAFRGKTYRQLCAAIAQQCHDDDPVIPVGLKGAGTTVIDANPKKPNQKLLTKDDKILVIAYDKTSLKQLEELQIVDLPPAGSR